MTIDEPDGGGQAVAERPDHYIPVRKSDLLKALTDGGALKGAEREDFLHVCRLIGSIFHYEYFHQLETLRESYFFFNPEQASTFEHVDAAVLAKAYADFMQNFVAVMRGANFIEVTADEIARAHKERAVLRVTVQTPLEDFREVRFFRRGLHPEPVEISRWFGLRKRTVEVEVYQNVVVVVAIRPPAEITSAKQRKRLARSKVRPGSVLIKCFRHVASADLNALFPNVRVTMSLIDKLMLGVPAVVGGVPLMLKLGPSLTVLFLVVGFYLGLTSTVADEDVTKALAALGGLIALGAFMFRQWMRYERQSLKYQKEITDNVYFRSINGNAGFFDYLIGTAEEQECREAFLAYYFLHVAEKPPTQAELDARIEQWLKDTFKIDAQFEVGDALAKLRRLGLIRRTGERLSTLPPDQALVQLDQVWDGFFGPHEAAVARRATS